jgi:hypothetical protein
VVTGMLDIRDYGAVGDGTTVNTVAIQKAIDECSAGKSDGVMVLDGQYVTGTIRLKSNVTLRVSAGAELLGSIDIADYGTDTHKNMYRGEPQMDRCLIYAEDARSVAIEGNGVIDGRGHRHNFPNKGDAGGNRPMLIRFLNCTQIRVRDIKLQNPAAWTSAWLYCSDIVVDGITIHSRANGNGDGLDFDGCSAVRVCNCSFDNSDDSICLQTSRVDMPCRDVTITNCIFSTKWAGLRIGLLSRGDFENVIVSNCVFKDIEDSGLKIQLCEGGEMRNMLFTGLLMKNVPRPVFMTFCQQRACVDAPVALAPMKSMRNMVFSNITIDDSDLDAQSAIIVVGMPGEPVKDVVFRDIRFLTPGGGVFSNGTRDESDSLLPDLTPELLGTGWPEFYSFGRRVPSFGFYANHVDGLVLDGCGFDSATEDTRPAVICHDIGRHEFRNLTTSGEPAEILLNGRKR